MVGAQKLVKILFIYKLYSIYSEAFFWVFIFNAVLDFLLIFYIFRVAWGFFYFFMFKVFSGINITEVVEAVRA